MKRFCIIIASIIFLLITITGYSKSASYFYDGKYHEYTYAPITLAVNGKTVTCDVPPLLFNNYTLVPVRVVSEYLGAVVTWDQRKSQVRIKSNTMDTLLTINSPNVVVNEKNFTSPIAPKIINNRTMMPVRFVSEALGMVVDWDSANRVVNVHQKYTNITEIQGDISGSSKDSFELTVNFDAAVTDYEQVVLNDPPRLAIDIKNINLKCSENPGITENKFVKSVRASLNDDPNKHVRVVADLKDWSNYHITLSADKKSLIVVFSPVHIDTVNFVKGENSDKIDVSMKFTRKPIITSLGSATEIAVDIPLSVIDIQNIYAQGDIIKSIRCSQVDGTSSRLLISTSGICLVEYTQNADGFSLIFSNLESKNLFYENKEYPRFILNSQKIDTNYLNYKYWNDGNSCIFNTTLSLSNIADGKIFIGDNIINNIEIKNSSDGTTISINSNGQFDYGINTSDNASLIIDAFPRALSTDNQSPEPSILGKLVIIDPGHGGSESGAVSDGIYEKNVNLSISQKLYTLLKNAGINVEMTRQSDENVDLATRADIANNKNASLFVSVHSNAGNGEDNGTMTLFYPANFDVIYGMSPERVAQITQQELTGALGSKDVGIWKRPRLAVLNATQMPAILAEVGYVTNTSERAKLVTESYQQKAAQGLYNAIVKSLKEMTVNQQKAAQTIRTDGVYDSGIPELIPPPAQKDLEQRSINGFLIPPKASSKCDYSGAGDGISSIYDLTIKLDYAKELAKTATLEEQRAEVRQVLATKLDTNTVNKIMNMLSMFTGYHSDLWEGDDNELSNNDYTVLVRALRYSGIATVNLIHK